jgi:hypothetical protein
MITSQPGSPGIAKAAQLLIENHEDKKYMAKVALLIAGYDKATTTSKKSTFNSIKEKEMLNGCC